MISVNNVRSEIERRLTASLRRRLEVSLPKLYAHARRNAVLALEDHDEADAAALPPRCPHSLDLLLDGEWLPERVML